MSSVINNGLSGLKAQQAALSTTAHNISNVNTEGYSRQTIQFGANPALKMGDIYMGTGVDISGITRQVDGFVLSQVRESTVSFNQMDSYHSNAAAVDSLIADEATGVIPTVDQFFSAMQDASADPASLPLRQMVISQSQIMTGRFDVLYTQLDDVNSLTNQQVSAVVGDINVLAQSVADLNKAIANNNGSSAGLLPNDLLDQRDQVLKELASLVGITVINQSDNTVSVTIGSGQPLVVGAKARQLGVQTGDMNATALDVTFLNVYGQTESIITEQLTGGKLGGLIDFRNEILDPSFRELGRVAIAMAATVNDAHRQGMDLEGDVNKNFFVDVNDRNAATRRVVASSNNAPPINQQLSVTIEDIRQLTTDDYQLTFGPTNSIYTLTRVGSDEVVARGTIGNTFPVTIKTEGIAIHLEAGTFKNGDNFLIRPTRFGASELALEVKAPQDIAFASPVLAQADSQNSGTGVISLGEVLDINTPAFATKGQLSPPLLIRFTSETTYDVLNNSDPANPVQLNPPLRNQVFVAGSENKLFSDMAGSTAAQSTGAAVGVAVAGTSSNYPAETFNFSYRDPKTLVLTQLAPFSTAVGDSAATVANKLNTQFNGIQASAFTEAKISNLSTTSIDINGQTISTPTMSALVTGINNNATLKAQGLSAQLSGNQVIIRDANGDDVQFQLTGGGATLQGSNFVAGDTATVGGSVQINMNEGYSLKTSGNGLFTASPAATSTYFGFQATISGKPKVGDTFTVNFNKNGQADNRNAVKLLGLQSKGVVEQGRLNYADAYGKLVESVGSLTKNASIAKETQQSLLFQAEQRRESIAGVNLDEEASNMVKFEQAYNAAAQVIAVARSLFDTLIAAFR
ncbi:MAG TPA: flagellar hook-associated protein FlgK [Pseudomonadales bacterium]|nr:flagellar hook-associated protein FlgK [Pseudomonadales bacterium]